MGTATLIRQATTGRFLASGLAWAEDQTDAVAFSDVDAARRFLATYACEPGALEVIERSEPAAA